jgi:uncharacterized membrane-anchored protein YjiN (DUF445 family)
MQSGEIALQPIQDEQQKQLQLTSMKRRATGLLVAALVVYVVARVLETRWPGFGYLRATAEAAMIGGLADWFAVTALFRYPMGLRIPHTAIIPNRKDRIGRSLGNFVQNNFLSPTVIRTRLRAAGAARKGAEWLARPEHGESVGRHAAAAVTGVVQVLRDEDVQDIIQENVMGRVRKTQVTPVVARVLSLVTQDNRHQELLDAAIRLLGRLVDENRDTIRERVGRETPWWVPTQVDDKIYEKLVGRVENTLHEVSSDPDHPLRGRFNEAVAEFIVRLQESPSTIQRGEQLKEEVLSHPAVRDYSASLWGDLKASLIKNAADPESEFRRRIGHAVTRVGQSLVEDDELLEKVELWIENAVIYVVEQYRHEIADLISTTVAAWDPEDTTRKIELQIGKDLQFIRINGTLVGGLAGFLIYALGELVGF